MTETAFTIFYTMLGDTVFDAYMGARQVSDGFAWFISIITVFLGNVIIINVALIMVEDSYIDSKFA